MFGSNNKKGDVDYDITLPSIEEIGINEDFEALLQNSSSVPKRGDYVMGTVVSCNRDYAVVDIGGKCSGIIAVDEFNDIGIPEPGTEIKVYVENVDGGKYGGRLILSRTKAILAEKWEEIEKRAAEGCTFVVEVLGRVKGGYAARFVDYPIVTCFLPASQVSSTPFNENDLGQITAKIIKFDKIHGNIVVSKRLVDDESNKQAQSECILKIQVGAILTGTVKNVTPYGAFIQLSIDGVVVDGLVHSADCSWDKIECVSSMLTVGDPVTVKVLNIDYSTGRISLGIKQLTYNSWKDLVPYLTAGTRYKGKVSAIAPYGIFVEMTITVGAIPNQLHKEGDLIEQSPQESDVIEQIHHEKEITEHDSRKSKLREEKVIGLVHSSEITYVNRNATPSKYAYVGQEVEVQVLSFDYNSRRIGLSMRACNANLWFHFVEVYHVGSFINAVIKNPMDFGVFLIVTLNGVEYTLLMPWYETTWDKFENTKSDYSINQQIEVMITRTDPEKGKATCSTRYIGEKLKNFIPIWTEMAAKEYVVARIAKVKTSFLDLDIEDRFMNQIDIEKVRKLFMTEIGENLEFDDSVMDGKKIKIKIAPPNGGVMEITPLEVIQ